MDCDCPEDIQPVPDYHPYTTTGDFNGDGVVDFAAALVNRTATANKFALIVFNGPFGRGATSPAFLKLGLDLKGQGLFFGPPRPKPYRLLFGAFESEGAVLRPRGNTYELIGN